MNETQQQAICALEAIKAAQDAKRRDYHRNYYSRNKEQIAERRLRHAAEAYAERLEQQQIFNRT